jgi:hypothetical protein
VREPIAAGTVLVVEKAVVRGHWSELPAKLSACRDCRTRALFDGQEPHGPDAPVPLPEWPLHVPEGSPDWKRVAELNALAMHEARDDETGFLGFESTDVGMVAPLSSLVNHSCLPNLTRVHIGSYVILRTNRLVKAGDELTFGYCTLAVPLTARRDYLAHFGFTCTCARCELEAVEPDPGVDAVWEAFHKDGTISKPSDLVRLAAQARELCEATIDDRARAFMEFGLLDIFWALADTVRSLGESKAALEVFRSLEHAIAAVVPEGPLRARVANEIVATALLAESDSNASNLAEGVVMYREVADSVGGAVKAHRRALGGGSESWWVFVGRVLPDSVQALSKALQQSAGEGEGVCVADERKSSPAKAVCPAVAPIKDRQDENRAPNTQSVRAVSKETELPRFGDALGEREEARRREKEAAIWGNLIRKEATERPASPPKEAAAPAEKLLKALDAEIRWADASLLVLVRGVEKGTPVHVSEDGSAVQVGEAAPLSLPVAVDGKNGGAKWRRGTEGKYLELRFPALDVLLTPD